MLLKKSHFFDDFLDFSFTIFLILIEMEVMQTLRQDIINCCTFIQTSRRVLENHLDTTDVYCTGNYVKVRNKINGKKVVGHLEQADQFQLLDIQKGWVKIKVTYSDKTSPDSHKGMTGWLNADYVDCYCDAGEYAGEGEANGFVYADENCRNYDEVIELYIRALKERWNSDKISEFGFEPCCFVSSMESDGYLLKDLNGDGNDELIILPRSCLEYRDAEERGILYAV